MRSAELEARLCGAEVRVLEERKARQLLKLRLVSAEEDGAMARAEAGALDDALHAERAAREAAETAAARALGELGALREEVGVLRTKASMHEADLASARRQADTLEQRWVSSQPPAGARASPSVPAPVAETAGLRQEINQLRDELQSLRSVAEKNARGAVRRGGALRQQLVPAARADPEPEKPASPVQYPPLKRKPGRPKGSKNKPAKEQNGKKVQAAKGAGAASKRSAMVDIAVRYEPPAGLDEDTGGRGGGQEEAAESPRPRQLKRLRRSGDLESPPAATEEKPDRAPLADVNTIWDLSRHRSKDGKSKGKKLLQNNSTFFNKLPPSMLFGKGFQMPKMNKPGPK